jgi:hypothetical protein
LLFIDSFVFIGLRGAVESWLVLRSATGAAGGTLRLSHPCCPPGLQVRAILSQYMPLPEDGDPDRGLAAFGSRLKQLGGGGGGASNGGV